MAEAFNIFINYRREDSAGHAGRLYDALARRFGDEHVFMDVDAIDPGEDFTQVVRQSVGSCDVLLALIGRDWITAADSEGRRRLDNPSDWVRVEIQTALERSDTRVIPTLVQGADMPRGDDLPEPLQKLSHRNAVKLSDTGWRSDVERLVRSLEEIAGASAPPRPAEPARSRLPDWKRSRWFVPGLVGAVVLLLAGIAAAILLSGSGNGASAEERAYVRRTDDLLAKSARTLRTLNRLIPGVERKTISRDEAVREINRIIGQRRSQADEVSVDPPTSFERANDLLRQSLIASLRDDEAIERWIVALYDGSPNAQQLKDQHTKLSGVASDMKVAFREEYNRRCEDVDLPGTTVAY